MKVFRVTTIANWIFRWGGGCGGSGIIINCGLAPFWQFGGRNIGKGGGNTTSGELTLGLIYGSGGITSEIVGTCQLHHWIINIGAHPSADVNGGIIHPSKVIGTTMEKLVGSIVNISIWRRHLH